MTDISQLQPQALWQHFSTICSIPHPSKHEQAMIDWVLSVAAEHQLEVTQDEIGNVIISKPATAGMEDRQGVILQAHLDMVPQANNDTPHDFTKDPIKAYVDNGWVTAEGTTLGADNGIGAASILGLLTSSNIPHGPLEALFTIDEEAGMTGAFGLKPGYFKGNILINTDSEQEGEVYLGCAGGGDSTVSFVSDWEASPSSQAAIKLSVKGLKGGHSGCDVDTGRANANKLIMGIAAKALQSGIALNITAIKGGSLRNAIPREAELSLNLAAEQVADFEALVKAQTEQIQAEFSGVETGLTISTEKVEAASRQLTTVSSQQIIFSIDGCINGVVRMSQTVEGVVETSLNLGVIYIEDEQVKLMVLVRSLLDEARLAVERHLVSQFSLVNASVKHSGAYPGWKPENDSLIKQIVEKSYQQIYGSTPKTMVIHAGLECGLFKNAYPTWDMVSIGPTIKFPHSPDEKVEIASVAKYWDLLKTTLANIPSA